MRIGALFGPQHGFRSDLQENMIESPHAHRRRRGGVPVYSLYSETREPTPEMLAGLDALVIDLQDVGTRIYTYIYTMAGCLKAARKAGLPVVVCDRPNPIGGLAVEGPMLEAGFESFVGLYPIPMRHGMTIGELARMFNEHFGIGAKLEVVWMQGWTRAQYADETGCRGCMPSPNIPTLDTCVVYPGTVLFEGTNVSEGRGTDAAVRAHRRRRGSNPEPFAAGLNDAACPACTSGPRCSSPRSTSTPRRPCGGCQIHVTDRATFRPVETGVAVLEALARRESRRVRLARSAVRVRVREAADRHPLRVRRAARRCWTPARRPGNWREAGTATASGPSWKRAHGSFSIRVLRPVGFSLGGSDLDVGVMMESCARVRCLLVAAVLGMSGRSARTPTTARLRLRRRQGANGRGGVDAFRRPRLTKRAR